MWPLLSHASWGKSHGSLWSGGIPYPLARWDTLPPLPLGYLTPLPWDTPPPPPWYWHLVVATEVGGKQDGISVEFQPPTFRQYGLYGEQVRTCHGWEGKGRSVGPCTARLKLNKSVHVIMSKLNKSDHVWIGGGGDPCTVRSKLNKFEHVQRDGPLISGGADPVQRVGWGWTLYRASPEQTDWRTRLKIIPPCNFVGRR